MCGLCMGGLYMGGLLRKDSTCAVSTWAVSTRQTATTPPAAGIDEATPQGPKRLPALVRQSDLGSYCRARAGPFSAAAE